MIDWEGILSRDGPAAWRTAWRVLRNRADADECYQEACLAALEFSNSHTVANWRALLQRLAAARAIDRLRLRVRQGRRQLPFEEENCCSDAPLPSARAENAELAAALRAALAQIPASHAEVFWLFHREGWSYIEIADAMAVSTQLVGVWLQRARQRLRELLTVANKSFGEVSP
jgi:RNA polymerase sigma-70 factor (ECF subfamily)